MIGQKKLQDTIQELIQTNSLPRTILLEGDLGCGKHTLVKETSVKLGLDVQDITDTLTLEVLQDISVRPTPYVYIIDASGLSIREQNVILKFLEEPLKNSYIFVLCVSKYSLIPTVKNRCYCLSFEQYSTEELKSFIDFQIIPEVLEFANTPGRLLSMVNAPVDRMIEFVNSIYQKISNASYSNILKIPSKCYYKDAGDGLLEFDLFVYVLLQQSVKLYNQSVITYNMYELVSQFYNDCMIPHINKQQLFEHFIFNLKLLTEGACL